MNAAGALWTAEQHRLLAALGHALWVRGALPETVPAAAPADAPAMVQAAPVRHHGRAHGHDRDPAPPPARREFQPGDGGRMPARRIETDVAPAVDAVPVRRAPAGMPDRLHFALIRAAGINPNTPEGTALIGQLPPSSGLRGNPAAKRALWPRLRALRAGKP